jgi:hypothetical protein
MYVCININIYIYIPFLTGEVLETNNFMLAVDNRVLMCNIPNFILGLSALFSVYYILNIQYPVESASTLEFIQRYFTCAY